MSANFCGSFDRHVRNQMARFPEFNLGPDYTVRTNVATGMNLGAGINDGCGMDFHLPPIMAP